MRKLLRFVVAFVLLAGYGFAHAGSLTLATGGSAISADTNIATGTATWTILSGPTYTESNHADVSTGTIVFNVPAGFSFNASSTPTATVTRISTYGRGPYTDLALSLTSITASAITFTVTRSANGVHDSITWGNIQVRPNVGSPLASGNITLGGTASLNNVSAGANLGTLTEVAGSTASQLLFGSQPSTSTVNSTLSPITVQVSDSQGNVVTSSSATVTLAIGNNPGGGTLSGTTSVAAVNGIATFSNLSIDKTGTGYTLVASSSGLTGATSSAFDITAVGSMICYTDNFSNLNNWSVGNVGGSFGNPVALNNRLRLTDASGDVSTYATLNKLFPAFGNKIVVQFTDYAYGGTDPGADGIGIVLSDASVAPVAGAFGGSLGYAPKQVALGGDTTHPGFTGGWLGVGIDEYGNYSANTEGRTGGSAPGVTPESVAVRGSGSGYMGYAYMTGTSSLSPLGIDTDASGNHLMTSGPGYKYRITVDHSDSIHAMTSVERDTGSGYVTLIQPFDAKAVSGQAGVPTDWYLSFTGATGGANNIHEIANLSVCSNSQQTVSLDHLELDHDATACGSDDLTVKACGNASCSVLYVGNVTATLTATGASGAYWSANPVSFSGGQTTVTLTGSTGSTYTLGTSSVSPTPANATQCVGGPTASPCQITFVSACFDAVETGQNPATPIYTKLSGTPFNLDVLAVSGSNVNTSYAGTVSVSLVDPTAASGNCADTATGLTLPASLTFTNRGGSKTYGRIPVSFNYPNAARDVRVRIVSGTQPVCSSDDFAIRPQTLALSTSPALNPSTNTIKAGANFNLIANSGVSSGYTGTPQIDATQIVDHNNVTIAGSALTGSFPAATGTSSSGSFQYQDVGTISLKTNAVTDPNFTAVDQVTGIVGKVDHGASSDCVLNSTSNTTTPGTYGNLYGCTIGAASLGPLGRFYPDHYEVNASLTPACAAGGFSYMSQPALGISLGVSAMSSSGVLLSRYTTGGNFSGLCSPNSCLATLDIEGDNAGTPINPLSARLSPNLPGSLPASTAWSAGQYTASGSAYSFNRLANPDGPYDNFALKVSVADNDGALITKLNGATVAGSASVLSPLTKIRYGRLALGSVYGSELLPIRIPVTAQYFTSYAGTTPLFAINTLDSCTVIPAASVAVGCGALVPGKCLSTLPTPGSVTLSGGIGQMILSAPGAGNQGAVNIAVNLGATGADANCIGSGFPKATAGANMPWLRANWGCQAGYNSDPNARATFGIAASPFIYLRENY